MLASPAWFSRLLHTVVCVSPQLPNELVFASKLWAILFWMNSSCNMNIKKDLI